jgi:uncharacterized Rossmann fold enzyme
MNSQPHHKNTPFLERRFCLPGTDFNVDDSELEKIYLRKSEDGRTSISTEDADLLPAFPEDQVTTLSEQTNSIPELKPLHYVIVFGFDDGAYLKEVLTRLPASSRLLCIEPWPELFTRIAQETDLSQILSDNRLDLYVGREFDPKKFEPLAQLVSRCEKSIVLRRASPYLKPDINYQELEKIFVSHLVDTIRFKKVIFNTTDLSSHLYLKNAGAALYHGDLNHLKERIKNKPVAVIGLGPTLATQIEKLKKIQNKIFIFATDNAVSELLLHDIEPDLVFHVEWHFESLSFYKDLKFKNKPILCYIQGSHPQAVQNWPFDKIAYTSHYDFPFRSLTQQWPNFQGTTVGDLAITVAVLSKAKEIYLVGMDFSCPAGNYHYPNTSSTREIYSDVSRFWSFERIDWQLVYHSSAKSLTKGWNDEDVYTRQSFKKSIQFLHTIKATCEDWQTIKTTSQAGAWTDTELADLDELDSTVDINKELKPSQMCALPNEVLKIVRRREFELREYFHETDLIHKVAKKLAQMIIKKETHLPSYQEFYDDFTRRNDKRPKLSGLKWIENMIMNISPQVRQKVEVNMMRMKDKTSSEEAFSIQLDLLVEYIEIIREYKSILDQYLTIIRQESEKFVS